MSSTVRLPRPIDASRCPRDGASEAHQGPGLHPQLSQHCPQRLPAGPRVLSTPNATCTPAWHGHPSSAPPRNAEHSWRKLYLPSEAALGPLKTGVPQLGPTLPTSRKHRRNPSNSRMPNGRVPLPQCCPHVLSSPQHIGIPKPVRSGAEAPDAHRGLHPPSPLHAPRLSHPLASFHNPRPASSAVWPLVSPVHGPVHRPLRADPLHILQVLSAQPPGTAASLTISVPPGHSPRYHLPLVTFLEAPGLKTSTLSTKH